MDDFFSLNELDFQEMAIQIGPRKKLRKLIDQSSSQSCSTSENNCEMPTTFEDNEELNEEMATANVIDHVVNEITIAPAAKINACQYAEVISLFIMY